MFCGPIVLGLFYCVIETIQMTTVAFWAALT